MREAGYKFRVVVPNVDESLFPVEGVKSAEYVKVLSLAKAKDVAARFPDAVVIGADTIVDFQGEIIGKPSDAAHAEQIVRKLFSRPHKVITGVAVVRMRDNLEIVKADTTIVYPRKMSERQIAGHIKGNTWQGKAGAYGIQETGDEFVERIEGSMTNVMGFPMELVARMLKPFLK